MSSNFPVYRHQGNMLFGVLMTILVVIGAILLLGVTELAFEKIGFSSTGFLLILVLSFIGSFVNVPLRKISNVENVVEYREVRYYWVTYRIPQYEREKVSTLVTINLGGAIIPILVSVYLLAINVTLVPYALLGVAVSSVLIHLVARKVRGVGIVTPTFIPPLVAALISVLIYMGPGSVVIAYVSGTLGALIGADLSNLRGITKLGAPVVSIGGAGTFDGIFLTGIIAVILVLLISIF